MTSPYEPKMGPQKWYARTPRRLGCTTQSTWNYLCFIWLSHIFQLDSVVQPLRRGVSLCDGYKIDAVIRTPPETPRYDLLASFTPRETEVISTEDDIPSRSRIIL